MKPPRLALVWLNGPYEGRCFTLLPEKTTVFGSSQEADLFLPSTAIAEKHCRLEPRELGLQLVDTSGTRGTYVNNRRVEECPVDNGDVIRIGTWAAELFNADLSDRYNGSCEMCLKPLHGFESLSKLTTTVKGDRTYCPVCFDRRLEVDRHLGDYRILRKMGRGQKEVLYIAEHVVQKARVALKILRANLLMGRDAVRIFLNRSAASLRLVHPHVVRTYEVRSHFGSFFVVMEVIEGRCIFDTMRKRRVTQISDGVRLALQICSALSYLYRNKVHAGLMLPRDIYLHRGNIKLRDFWIFQDKAARGSNSSRGLFVKRHYMPYLPPEFFDDHADQDLRSDMYLVGAFIYQMLTGHAPFAAKRVASLIRKIESSAPRPIEAFRESTPAKLKALLERTLAKDPADRYPDMKSFVRALKTCLK